MGPQSAHKPVSRPMVDDNLYPGTETGRQNWKRERERQRGEEERRKRGKHLHSRPVVDRRASDQPLFAFEDLFNLISGWERVIPLHYFIKRLNRAGYDHTVDFNDWTLLLNVASTSVSWLLFRTITDFCRNLRHYRLSNNLRGIFIYLGKLRRRVFDRKIV